MFLNGDATGVTYSGEFLAPLGTITIDAETGQAVSLVAFLFGGTGDIVFAGTASTPTTFNAAGTRGHIDFNPAPGPLPAAGWLLVAGLGGLAAMRRRKAAVTA